MPRFNFWRNKPFTPKRLAPIANHSVATHVTLPPDVDESKKFSKRLFALRFVTKIVTALANNAIAFKNH